MRIISGRYKKKTINPPRNFTARPTTDMAKESLFNILLNHFDLEELEVLDLFSGSGSISYEFASRGSKSITAVELNFNHFSFIQKTAKELGFTQLTVVKADAFRFLKMALKSYDLIFADPPYEMDEKAKITELVFERKLLNPGGRLIIEHSEADHFDQHPNFIEVRQYGKVHFSFLG